MTKIVMQREISSIYFHKVFKNEQFLNSILESHRALRKNKEHNATIVKNSKNKK